LLYKNTQNHKTPIIGSYKVLMKIPFIDILKINKKIKKYISNYL